jgi:hypothetical protein
VEWAGAFSFKREWLLYAWIIQTPAWARDDAASRRLLFWLRVSALGWAAAAALSLIAAAVMCR